MNELRMMQLLTSVLLAVSLVLGSCYTIRETERGVLLRFGEVVDSNLKPGIGFKWPFINEVRTFDARMQLSDAEATDFLTSEKKSLRIDSYAAWRIHDVSRFYTATGGNLDKADMLLQPLVKDTLKNKVSVRSERDVIGNQRDQFMVQAAKEVNVIAQRELGIEVTDVRVKRIDYPQNVSDSVFNRMRSERERLARENRATGTELGEGVRADADRQQRVILAEAYRDAEKLRGEGDARAAEIYAAAYSRDADFYQFWRSMQVYRSSVGTKGDVMVVKPEGEFFKYFDRKAGK